MKSKMKTGLTAMLLLLAFSCTKESTNSTAANQPSVSARQSSDALQQSLEDQDVTPIAGTKWILYYDWESCVPEPDARPFGLDGGASRTRLRRRIGLDSHG